MKKLICVFLLTFAFVFNVAAQKPTASPTPDTRDWSKLDKLLEPKDEWITYNDSDDQRLQYNLARITRSKSVVKAWTRIIAADKDTPVATKAETYGMYLMEFDCISKSARTMSVTTYYIRTKIYKNKINDSFSYVRLDEPRRSAASEHAPFVPIVPESTGDSLMKIVCKK